MREPHRFTTLSNGLRIATQAMPQVETASIGIWVDAGSRDEEAHENGLAHMLEHMAFKGTGRRSAAAIAEEIEDVGGALNAYTSREQTAYYARVLADDVPLAADLITDILRNPTHDESELEKERNVILQEIGEVQDTPGDLVFDLFQEAAFPDQPLGRSVLGPADVVAKMPREALGSFTKKHYDPSRMILAAAGKVDHERIVRLAEDLLGDMPNGSERTRERAVYKGGERILTREVEQVHLCLGLEAFAFTDPDFYALQVFSTALGGGMSSRLFQELREKRGLCYSVFTFTSLHEDTGLLGVYAGTEPEDANELMTVLNDEIRRTADGFTEPELKRARAQLKASLLMSLESCSAVAEDLARQYLCFGNHLDAATIAERIEAVDEAAIMRVAERVLGSPAPTIALIMQAGQ